MSDFECVSYQGRTREPHMPSESLSDKVLQRIYRSFRRELLRNGDA